MTDGIFSAKDYRDYLNWVIRQKPGKGRGMRSELARAARCQLPYVSRVLRGDAHFSLEQIDLINQRLAHSPEEARFMILLVQHARAGTPSLKRHFDAEIAQALEKRANLKERLNIKTVLSPDIQARYYSAWYYAAIHILISIEAYQTREALARHLSLPITVVTDALEFLVSAGLASRTADRRYEIGVMQLHLEKSSPLISKHHANWRLQALKALEVPSSEDVHYSLAVGISEEDARRIRAMIVEFIHEAKLVMDASPQEDAHCFALDFFRIR